MEDTDPFTVVFIHSANKIVHVSYKLPSESNIVVNGYIS